MQPFYVFRGQICAKRILKGGLNTLLPAGTLSMQICSSTWQALIFFDHDTFERAHNAQQFPLGLHLVATHASALGDMFSTSLLILCQDSIQML